VAEQGAFTCGQQLRPTDDTVLLTRDRPNCFEFASVSDGNSKQFAHTAIVGARAAPALPGFATTLRSYGPMSALPR
jgi:hypothetical protein